MSATTVHDSVHLPASIAPAVHMFERIVGAIFFTILGPVAVGIFIISSLVLAIALATLL